jgi:hypothetical protein
MNIRTILQTTILGIVMAAADVASAQVTGTSGGTAVNEGKGQIALSEGILRVNGVLYVVTAGIAHRVDLGDGQMATLDGVVRTVPLNATLPSGVPKATISGATGAVRNDPSSTATGATNTPQADRNKNVGNPAPGATTPSVR